MRVAVVAPEPVPAMWGGTERATAAMVQAMNELDGHDAELIKLPVNETTLPGLIDGYRRFAQLDLSGFDRVVSVKYPAWMIHHPDHVVHMFHPLRGLYDAYAAFGLPLTAPPRSPRTAEILELIGTRHDRAAVDEFFLRFAALIADEGEDAPDLVFPGPFARAVVHWLDRIALTPPRVRAHFAISATVAVRPEYFPRGIQARVLPLPTDLPLEAPPTEPGTALFTASRLDAPKRIGLIIDAMAHVRAPVKLRIAGTGPLADELKERAAGDERIEFLGFVPDDELISHYRAAIAVPFVPHDEDQGLICGEAASQGTPSITCTDSGGPAEFVADGVNGLITEPTPEHLGRALDRVTADPAWARRMGHAAYRRAAGRTWRDAATTLLAGPRTRRRPDTRVRNLASARGPATPFRNRRRAVVLATYGIDDPGHGGELRVHHLCAALAPFMDVDVLALVATPGVQPATTQVAAGLTSTVVPRSERQARVEDDLGLRAGQPLTDVLAGVDAHLTPAYLERLRQLASRADLVILAQPFLHPALAKAKVDLPFIVDTQNVELDLRIQSLGDSPVAPPVLDLLRRVEHDALTGAVAVSACSASDAARLAELYGLDADAIVEIPNGTVVPDELRDPADRRAAGRRWFTRLHWNWGSQGTEHLGVFFGSWHLPNLDAADFLVTLAEQCPELFIVSAGNHGAVFADRTVPDNIIFPGTVSATVKSTLLACASVALNPMRIGSGTNLKLIEFLGQGVPTVSTPFGARGLNLTHDRELLLAEPDDFAAAVRAVFADPESADRRARAGWEFAQDYRWEVIGATFRSMVSGILGVPLAA